VKTSDIINRVKEFLGFRKLAYQRTFVPEDRDNVLVLEDLAKFCRAHETTASANDRASCIMEGRREVWLRIQQHLQLSDDQLWKLYHKGE
jgi:hypothetical protein